MGGFLSTEGALEKLWKGKVLAWRYWVSGRNWELRDRPRVETFKETSWGIRCVLACVCVCVCTHAHAWVYNGMWDWIGKWDQIIGISGRIGSYSGACYTDDLLCCWLLLFSRSVMSHSFATPWTLAHQVPLSMGFSRQEYQSGLPFPPPGDLPDPGIKPVSPALQVDSSHWTTREDLLYGSIQ